MRLAKNTWKNRSLLIMCLPAMALFILFSYVPMFGIILAFKNFNFSKGIFGSDWCGLDNFKLLVVNKKTTLYLLRNTVGYYIIFTCVGLVGKIAIAIGINEFAHKKTGRFFQSCMILPTFITYIAVTLIAYTFLASNGMVNDILVKLGMKKINFYMNGKPWPLILTIIQAWKTLGYGSVLYLSVLSGIDQEIFEAAALDGAGTWQKIRYITIPMLVPMAMVLTLLGLGSIMHSDTGLFYQVTKNQGMLRPYTGVLDSYIMNALFTGTDYGTTAAFSFFQSVVGCSMTIGVNAIVRRVAPERALF